MKNDFANFVNKTDFYNKRINSNKAKHTFVKNEFKKWKTFESSLFIGQSYFDYDQSQNYLVFQPIYNYFKTIGNKDNILASNSKACLKKVLSPYYI